MLDTGLDTLISYNPWTLATSTPLADAARFVSESGPSQWPVLDADGQLAGLLTEARLAEALRLDPEGNATVGQRMERRVTPFELGGCPLAALERLLREQRRLLPVVDGHRVVGTLATWDYLREMSYGEHPLAKELILDYLLRKVESIESDASLAAAHTALEAANARHMIVVQGDFPLGAVSRAGLWQAEARAHAARLQGGTFHLPTVGQLLSSCPTIAPGRTLGEAAGQTVDYQIDSLAVVNQGATALGLISEELILQALLDGG